MVDDSLEPLIKRAVKRRKLKRVAAVAGGMVAAGVLAGGAAWQQKHPRDPKGRFRDTPDQPRKPKQENDSEGRGRKPDDRAGRQNPDESQAPKKTIPSRNADDLQGRLSGFDTRRKVMVDKGRLEAISAKEFAEKYPWVKVDFKIDRSNDPNPKDAWKQHEVDQVLSGFHHFAQQYPDTAKRVKFLMDSPDMKDVKPGVKAQMMGAVGEDGDFMMGVMFRRNLRTKPPSWMIGKEFRGKETNISVNVEPHHLRAGRLYSHAFGHDNGRRPGWSVDMVDHPGASPIELLTLHELGHALHFHGMGAMFYDHPDTAGYMRNEKVPVPEEFTSTERVRLLPDEQWIAQTASRILYNSLRAEEIQPGPYSRRTMNGLLEPVISVYGQTDRAEYFAENFAWNMANRRRAGKIFGYDRATDDVLAALNDHIGRYEAARRLGI